MRTRLLTVLLAALSAAACVPDTSSGDVSKPLESNVARPPRLPTSPPVLGKLGEACGGRGRPQDCEDGLYCKRLPAAACGRFDAPGTCSVQPVACTKEYKPVCGCDGLTYGNECTAGAAGISVDYEGSCS